jgi:hypothetical protein
MTTYRSQKPLRNRNGLGTLIDRVLGSILILVAFSISPIEVPTTIGTNICVP